MDVPRPPVRSLAHSLFAVAAATLAFRYAARRLDRGELAVPFLLGWLSHVLVDGYLAFLDGKYFLLTYLLYPVSPAPQYGDEGDFASHLAGIHLSPDMWLELALSAAAFALFAYVEYRIRRSHSDRRAE